MEKLPLPIGNWCNIIRHKEGVFLCNVLADSRGYVFETLADAVMWFSIAPEARDLDRRDFAWN